MRVKIKRVYEKPELSDGKRILVDRLWPRGISKESAKIDAWLKGVAPSDKLRKWFNHEPEKWNAFQKKYKEELKSNEVFAELKNLVKKGKCTLVYAAKDEEHNNAVFLSKLLLH